MQVLCNALWYTTNDHSTINDAAKHKGAVLSFPQSFHEFDGYNDVKRKKLKSLPLKSTELNSHAETLYSLLMKPVINSSVPWKMAGTQIRELADCLAAYSAYQKKQTEEMKAYQTSDYPARTIDKEATVEHRHRSVYGVQQIYSLLDDAIKSNRREQTCIFR